MAYDGYESPVRDDLLGDQMEQREFEPFDNYTNGYGYPIINYDPITIPLMNWLPIFDPFSAV